jgi:ketosteroid isomerase-like protein
MHDRHRMKSFTVVGALIALNACNVVPVEVSTRHPSPRPLWPRPLASVKTYETRPPGGIAVYGLEADGEDLAEVDTAIRERAASLGCDGVLLTVRIDQGTSMGVTLTGKLNVAREYENARIDALCIVDPASVPEVCRAITTAVVTAATAPAAAQAVSTPADIEGSARSALEQWRQAQELRSSEALAKLYAHDASLNVVDDGTRLVGWTAFERALRDRLDRATAIRVRLQDVQVHAIGTTAVVVATMLRELSDAGASKSDAGLLTLVLRAPAPGDPTGWVIISEHYSRRM